MTEQYVELVLKLVLWAVSCHGQQVPGLTEGQLHSRVRELEKTVEPLLKHADIQNSQTDEVGFHVSFTDDVRLSWGMKLPFDTVQLNIGEAYNKGAAEFTCPVPGTYLFSLNIVCREDTHLEISVEISNGNSSPKYILNTVCDHRKRILLGRGSLYCGETHNGGTAIVFLTRGEKVTVKKV